MEGLARIETLDRGQCLELLAQAHEGRLVYAVPAEPPGIVPVGYLLEGPAGQEHVVVRTGHGSRLGRAAPGTPVSLEVGEVSTSTGEGWSIVVGGVAEQVEDPEQVRRADERLQAWAPGSTQLFLRVPLTTVSGRRLVSQQRVIQLPEPPAPRWREPAGWTPATRTAAEYSTDFDGR